MSPSPAPEIVTLGCRLNIAESETIRGLVGARDTVVINSCAVTAEAAKQTRAAIRRARRARPTAELVVTGCASAIDPAGFLRMPEVDRVVPNTAKLWPSSWQAQVNRAPVAAFARHARAFVGVQTGCDHRCTFCIIPAGRGAARSTPIADAVERIAGLVAAGHREVVLSGVDLASWGADLSDAPPLAALAEAVLADVPALERLRFSSLDPAAIDDRFVALATDPRVAPHFHLSAQAGDDLILKRMRRRHARADVIRVAERLLAARPDAAIGADLIAGFPTEDETAFARTLALLDDAGIVHAHVFPYSPREGTPAARMPQVSLDLRRERAARLRAAAAARHAAWLASLVGSTQQVLVERPGDRGHAGNFAEVRFPSDPRAPYASPAKAGVQHRAARNWAPAYAGEAKFGSAASGLLVGKIVPLHITAVTATHLVGVPA